MLTPRELKALDDWRFQHRMPSRAAAVRELLKRGLTAEILDLAGDGRKSREFGIMSEKQHAPPHGQNGANSHANGHAAIREDASDDA